MEFGPTKNDRPFNETGRTGSTASSLPSIHLPASHVSSSLSWLAAGRHVAPVLRPHWLSPPLPPPFPPPLSGSRRPGWESWMEKNSISPLCVPDVETGHLMLRGYDGSRAHNCYCYYYPGAVQRRQSVSACIRRNGQRGGGRVHRQEPQQWWGQLLA